ncbi:DUF1028 domain-containing protein [Reyranella sp.]|uniref:DUF1028 domain-containing protein n=1 Tax=Reyranella sp. TaxID=1929291 RepID=UPI0037831FEA
MTFSITARCPETGMFGIAISSSSPAVAARCAHLRPGVGAIASQNVTDPRLGKQGLDLMAAGASAEAALAELKASPFIDFRQLALVDTAGRTAALSGAGALGIHAIVQGDGAVSAGNLLASLDVPRAMMTAFEAAQTDFPGRLLAALEAGLAAGGEAGPVHSAGLVVVRDIEWPIVDLRVDWSDTPLADLRRVWELYAPQLEDYVWRALDPARAAKFGVPGER